MLGFVLNCSADVHVCNRLWHYAVGYEYGATERVHCRGIRWAGAGADVLDLCQVGEGDEGEEYGAVFEVYGGDESGGVDALD